MTAPSLARLPSGLCYRLWEPPGEAVAQVLLVHGLGEHSGRYQQVADAFMDRGYVVLAPAPSAWVRTTAHGTKGAKRRSA